MPMEARSQGNRRLESPPTIPPPSGYAIVGDRPPAVKPGGGPPSRLRCAEVVCGKHVPRGSQKGFPAERLVFLGNRRDADHFSRFFDHNRTGAGMRCGVYWGLTQRKEVAPCTSP